MRIRERYELAEELRSRYRGSGRVERGQLLDSFCLAAGYGRKYAIKVLRWRRRLPLRRKIRRAKRYGSGVRAALKVCWEASDYLCSQRPGTSWLTFHPIPFVLRSITSQDPLAFRAWEQDGLIRQ